MGIKPHEIKKMTMWEYMACLAGWNKANGVREEKTATIERLRELGIE